MAAPTLTGSFSQQVEEVYDLIIKRMSPKYGMATAQKYANEWKAYAERHRNQGTVAQLYLAWFITQSNLPQKLGSDIITATKAAGADAAAIPQNISAISPSNLIGGIWGTLTNHNLWIRVGEFVVALILLDVGLKAFTNKSVIETTAKKIPGVGRGFK